MGHTGMGGPLSFFTVFISVAVKESISVCGCQFNDWVWVWRETVGPSLVLLMMDDVVMDRRWVTDRAPDGERMNDDEECGRKTPSSLLRAGTCLTYDDLTVVSRNTCSELDTVWPSSYGAVKLKGRAEPNICWAGRWRNSNAPGQEVALKWHRLKPEIELY